MATYKENVFFTHIHVFSLVIYAYIHKLFQGVNKLCNDSF